MTRLAKFDSSMDMEKDASLKRSCEKVEGKLDLGNKLKVESLDLVVFAKQHCHQP